MGLTRRLNFAVLLMLASLAAMPLGWAFYSSFVTRIDQNPSQHIWSLDNYRKVLFDMPMARWVVNSTFLSSVHSIIVVFVASTSGFALAKFSFVWRRTLVVVLMLTLFVPSQLLLPGSYALISKLGWIDSYFAIIVPQAVSAFGTLLMINAMRAVPDDLLNAARIDGCSDLRLWWHVAIPATAPTALALTLLSFLASWNSFLWPQVVLQSEGTFTLPIGIANMAMSPAYQGNPSVLMAATVVGIFPVVVLFLVLQRDFVHGVLAGSSNN